MIVRGDARALPLADGTVQCCVTSPPYWGLRDYKTGTWEGGDEACDHAPRAQLRGTFTGGQPASTRDKLGPTCLKCGARRVDRQLGLERTPEEYLAAMVGVFREVRRVLREDGTAWVNMGDCYHSGDRGGWRGDHHRWEKSELQKGNRGNADGVRPNRLPQLGLKDKDLCGIPWRLALALQADGWWLRSCIVWAKPNPMPESVTDRPTTSHEFVFLLTKAASYYYDQEAVREPPYQGNSGWKFYADKGLRNPCDNRPRLTGEGQPRDGGNSGLSAGRYYDYSAGRNLRTVWTIPTQPFPEAHFATFPEELARRCVLAGTSERGACAKCGKPWERRTQHGRILSTGGSKHGARATNMDKVSPLGQDPQRSAYNTGEFIAREKITLGFRPGCWCDAPVVPCLVLDPFAGSGTVGRVCRRHNRAFIGIELSEEYCRMARKRIDAPLEGEDLRPLEERGQGRLWA